MNGRFHGVIPPARRLSITFTTQTNINIEPLNQTSAAAIQPPATTPPTDAAIQTHAKHSGQQQQQGKQYYDDEEDEILVANADSLPTGSKEGFAVVHHFEFTTGDDANGSSQWEKVQEILPEKDIQRLQLTPHNVTVPVALMMMDPIKFPTVSRARKFCRHGRILLHRGPLGSGDVFLPDRILMGKVGDRVYPGGTYNTVCGCL